MYRKLNIEALIQIFIEIVLSVILVSGVYSKKINMFVHPKFNILLVISAAVLVTIAFFTILDLFRARHMTVINRYSLFIIPIVMISMLGLNSYGYMNINNLAESSAGSSADVSGYASQSNQLLKRDFGKKKNLYASVDKDGYVEINDQLYLRWYMDSYYDASKNSNMKFKFTGRVYKDKNMNGYVVIGRLGMLCCMADLQTSGFVYNEKGYENLKDGDWFTVRGKIRQNTEYVYNSEKLPQIYDVKLEKTRKPTDEMVYLM